MKDGGGTLAATRGVDGADLDSAGRDGEKLPNEGAESSAELLRTFVSSMIHFSDFFRRLANNWAPIRATPPS